MAPQIMVPAALKEVTEELEADDELLTVDELNELGLFNSLKKGPDFRKFPNTTILRRCDRGRVICEQGQAGATSFYILTTEDVIGLRELQLNELQETLRGKIAGAARFEMHPYFGDMSVKEIEKRLHAIDEELVALRARLETLPPVDGEAGAQREVAAAHLLLNMEGQQKPKGILGKVFGGLMGGARRAKRMLPAFIPVDGPADINAQTLRGPLHESEIFGEMSCMNRAPRSATVVAEEDCYVLEMLRNVMDMLHKDPAYKKHMDAVYRKRVLDTHVRRLSVFANISDEEFEKFKERIELVDFESGETIFEEGDDSDCLYIIRSGLVKVIKNAWYALRESEFKPTHWKALYEEFGDLNDENADLRQAVLSRMPPELQKPIADKKLSPAQQSMLCDSLNEFIRESGVHKALGKTRKEVLESIDGPQLRATISEYPKETASWSELEYRTFHRAFLEHIFDDGIPRRLETAGPRRTLAYIGRGDYIGEMGVFTGEPRSATCIAYDHPDSGYQQRIPDGRMGAVVSRVELIKISKADVEHLKKASPQVSESIRAEIERRKQMMDAVAGSRIGDGSYTIPQNREFERLGLIQGQKLMLIDLEKCTRCNACVEACVAAHDDGRTRLYLDGPRYDNYLVPVTCRKCLDPVCMIGCPVGAINRGDNGEIVIRDWCIGCRMCAEQCPYGSIQMNELNDPIRLTAEQKAILGEDATLKSVGEQAVVCDLCSSLPSQQPSCVYACPHDAAIRVNSQEFFLRAGS